LEINKIKKINIIIFDKRIRSGTSVTSVTEYTV